MRVRAVLSVSCSSEEGDPAGSGEVSVQCEIMAQCEPSSLHEYRSFIGTGSTSHLWKKVEKNSSCFSIFMGIGNGEPGDIRGNKTGSPAGFETNFPSAQWLGIFNICNVTALQKRPQFHFMILSWTGDLRMNFWPCRSLLSVSSAFHQK